MTARRMDRRRALKWLGGTAAGLSLLPHLSDEADARAATPRKDAPNILFIMTDDQAQSALSLYGNAILKTPSLDRI